MRPRDRIQRFPKRPPPPGRVGVALGLVGMLLFLIARFFPLQTEQVYGRMVYPRVVSELARGSELFSFSLAEWIFALAFISILTAFPRGYIFTRREGWSRARALFAGLVKACGALGAWWFWFLLLWGLNYARPPVDHLFRLAPLSKEANVRSRIVSAVETRLDLVRASVPEDEAGVAATPADFETLDSHLRDLQSAVLRDVGVRPIEHGRAKKFLLSPLLLRWSVSGVYGPYSGEPNIVWPTAPALLPFVVAHERAHLSGVAREDDASFIALLTCWRSERPEVRYAAWLTLHRALGQRAKDRAPGVQRDLKAIAEYARKYQGAEAPTMQRVYDAYLKTHGVKEGVRSYGRVAGLALRWLEQSGLPVEAGAPAKPASD